MSVQLKPGFPLITLDGTLITWWLTDGSGNDLPLTAAPAVNPTVTRNGKDTVQLSALEWSTSSASFSYLLPWVVSPGDSITWSAPTGWLVAAAGSLAGAAGASVANPPALESAVLVDSYGAAGDGSSDDTLAIRLALATGKSIRFSPGKTYLVSGSLPLAFAGQCAYLYGATIKRAGQVSTTITAPITGGTTRTIAVASTAGFFAGQTISTRSGGNLVNVYVTAYGSGYTSAPAVAVSGGGGTGATVTVSVDTSLGRVIATSLTGTGSGYFTQPTFTLTGGGGTGASLQAQLNTTDDNTLTIASVDRVGSTITISESSFQTSQPSGATLYTCGYTFYLTGGDNAVIGPGTLDGNRSGYTYYSWTSTNAVKVSAARCRVQGIHVLNAPGDGVQVNGDYGTVSACVLESLNGNGVHLSGCEHPLVRGVRVTSCNLDLANNHGDGGIIWSSSITDGTVSECYVNGTPRGGIGSIDSSDNSDVTVSACTLVNCLGAAVNINPSGAASAPGRIVLSGLRVRDCGLDKNTCAINLVQSAGTPTQYDNNVTITGCHIDQTNSCAAGIKVSNAKVLTITGNTLNLPSTSTLANQVGINAFTTAQEITICGNTINGFVTGIQLGGTTSAFAITVSGNTLLNQHSWGVRNLTGGGPAVNIHGNTVYGDSTVTGSYAAIETGSTCCCVGNSVYVSAGATSVGISVTGSNNQVACNQVRGAAAMPNTGVLCAASTTGNVIQSNYIGSTAATAINLNATTINATTAGSGNYTGA